MNEASKQAILDHYHECYPAECCGVIVNDAYFPCRNISTQINQFEIDPLDYVTASELGEITAIVHSHPDGSTDPSMPDRVQMNLGKLPWIITNGEDIATHYPSLTNYPPLLGRDYHHGLIDCYTLVQDYYQRELGISLGNYQRVDRWWEGKDSQSLYLDNFAREGFVVVDDEPQKHDVILCRLGRTEHVNHAVIYVADGKLKSESTQAVAGNSLILHHPYNRQSVRELYGEQWQNRTHCIVRHKDFL